MKKIQANLIGQIISSNSKEAYHLHKKSSFGEKTEDKIQYSASEALYLVESSKMEIYSKNKKIPKKDLLNKFRRLDKKIQIKYPVFKDLRSKGYVLKTALKFGADFRVYDKSAKQEKNMQNGFYLQNMNLQNLPYMNLQLKIELLIQQEKIYF